MFFGVFPPAKEGDPVLGCFGYLVYLFSIFAWFAGSVAFVRFLGFNNDEGGPSTTGVWICLAMFVAGYWLIRVVFKRYLLHPFVPRPPR